MRRRSKGGFRFNGVGVRDSEKQRLARGHAPTVTDPGKLGTIARCLISDKARWENHSYLTQVIN